MEGLFSVKSDVYSFGVLLLEIISGRRNTSFRLSEDANLIGYVSTPITNPSSLSSSNHLFSWDT